MSYPGNILDQEWRDIIRKLTPSWSRVRLSNEDIETIKKIAAKLP